MQGRYTAALLRQGYDAKAAYDARYTGSDKRKSDYDSAYRDTPITRNFHAIIISALKVADKIILQNSVNRKIRILDFGCGDGRYRTAVYKVADIVKDYGIEVELVAYDVSDNGLEAFQRKLQKEGFDKEHKRDNLQVSFITGSAEPEDIEKNKAAIGQVDVSTAIFGVISHIPGKESRVNALTMLKEITDGDVIITVPGWRILSKELEHHNKLRANNTPYKLATEPGDVYYTAKGGTENFYHVYWNKSEFVGEVAAAGLKGDISIAKIGHETTLTASPDLLAPIDAAISYYAGKLLPPELSECIAGYFLAKVHDKDKVKTRVMPRGLAEQYINNIYRSFPIQSHL